MAFAVECEVQIKVEEEEILLIDDDEEPVGYPVILQPRDAVNSVGEPPTRNRIGKICFICGRKVAKGPLKMQHHLNFRHPECMFRCRICCHQFSEYRLYRHHYLDCHQVKPFFCAQCDKCFISRARLARHVSEVHDSKTHVCLICKYEFRTLRTLERHMKRNVHNPEVKKKVQCERCKRHYVSKMTLKLHQERRICYNRSVAMKQKEK
jgi:hypothetical protein